MIGQIKIIFYLFLLLVQVFIKFKKIYLINLKKKKGYIDTKIRPWNNLNTKERNNGYYYENMFKNAINLKNPSKIISITSFNEWHEGLLSFL
jgi:hypothetical protein